MQMKPPTLPVDYTPGVHNEELIQALRLIHHATAPSYTDDAYHENAYGIADAILKKVDARIAFEKKLAEGG